MVKGDRLYALRFILNRLGIDSLKPPCLGLQEATFICPAWPNGLDNLGNHL